MNNYTNRKYIDNETYVKFYNLIKNEIEDSKSCRYEIADCHSYLTYGDFVELMLKESLNGRDVLNLTVCFAYGDEDDNLDGEIYTTFDVNEYGGEYGVTQHVFSYGTKYKDLTVEQFMNEFTEYYSNKGTWNQLMMLESCNLTNTYYYRSSIEFDYINNKVIIS